MVSYVLSRGNQMKLAVVVFMTIMSITGPVLAEDPGTVVHYKIKIDQDEGTKKMMQENKETFSQLRDKGLFGKWTNKENLPENAKDAYKKPSYRDNINTEEKAQAFIQCVRDTFTN